jgi:hypothetical protein
MKFVINENQNFQGPMLWFLKYFRRKIRRKNCRFCLQTKRNFVWKIDHNIGIWEKRQFFRRKLSKIAENCDHNIDPRASEVDENH